MSDQPQQPGVRISDLAISLIRTVVPAVAGSALTWAATQLHIVLSPSTSATVAVWAVAIVTAGYYAAARYLERVKRQDRWGVAARWLGRWMLGGSVARPVYAAPDERVKVIDQNSGMTKRTA